MTVVNALFEKLALYFSFTFVQYAVVVGVLIALCSSLLGVTLVLKRFSFIGDGLSHTAFGALSVATVMNLSNDMYFVLPVTVLCAVLLLRTGQNAKIKGDAAVAMVSVGSLAIGYLIMNVFATSSNLSGDVCSTLFGSTSILTLKKEEVYLCVILSALVLLVFAFLYNKIFAVTFDESFARAAGMRTGLYNLMLAVLIAVIIVLAMNLVGSLLISALVVFPTLSAMRVFKSFKSVIICSAVISVAGALIGILVAIVAGTPVGSTIVAVNIAEFLSFALAGKLLSGKKALPALAIAAFALFAVPIAAMRAAVPVQMESTICRDIRGDWKGAAGENACAEKIAFQLGNIVLRGEAQFESAENAALRAGGTVFASVNDFSAMGMELRDAVGSAVHGAEDFFSTSGDFAVRGVKFAGAAGENACAEKIAFQQGNIVLRGGARVESAESVTFRASGTVLPSVNRDSAMETELSGAIIPQVLIYGRNTAKLDGREPIGSLNLRQSQQRRAGTTQPVFFPFGKGAPSSGADVDLTRLSSTMVYAQVFNMIVEPEKFEGKTIKMRGQFMVYPMDKNENVYAVVISDATACCQQGLEFKWQGEHAYPADYPPEGSEIEVTGTFTTGQTPDGFDYFYIESDSVKLCR